MTKIQRRRLAIIMEKRILPVWPKLAAYPFCVDSQTAISAAVLAVWKIPAYCSQPRPDLATLSRIWLKLCAKCLVTFTLRVGIDDRLLIWKLVVGIYCHWWTILISDESSSDDYEADEEDTHEVGYASEPSANILRVCILYIIVCSC